MARESRSNVVIGTPNGPSVRERVVANPVPEVMSDKAGLEGLGRSFQQFFGIAAHVSQNVMDAERKVEIERIKGENFEQQNEAMAKAMRGEALTEEQMGDNDYFQTYEKALGIKYGAEMSNDFQQWATENVPVTGDIETAKAEFLKERLKNGFQLGTGSQIFDANLLSTFENKTASFRSNHAQAGVKARIVKGVQDYQSSIAERVDTIEASQIPTMIKDLEKLNPLDPNAAPSKVFNALMAGAGTSPARIARVLSLWNDPGSGDGTRSFAQMFPEAALENEEKLTNRYLSGKTFEGQASYDALHNDITNTNDPGTLIGIVQAGGRLDRIKELHGKGAQYESLKSAAMTKLEKIGKQVVTNNQLNEMLLGVRPVDVSLVRKHQVDFLKDRGIDMFQDPEGTANAITKFRGVISEDIKANWSNALANPTNPDRFSAAMRGYMALGNVMGDNVESMMESSVVADYRYAKRQVELNRKPFDEVMVDLQNARKGFEAEKKTTWSDIVGKTSSESEKAVRSRITSKLTDYFGSGLKVNESVMQDLMAQSKSVHIGRGGASEWKSAVDDAIAGARFGLSITPGLNGKIEVGQTLIPPVVTKTDANGEPVFENGRVVGRDTVPFGREVQNPATLEREDTIKTYESDRKLLVNALKETDQISDVDDISLNGRSAWAPKGVYLVQNKGVPVAFQLGSELSVNGNKVKIPDNHTEALKTLNEALTMVKSEDEAPTLVPGDALASAIAGSITKGTRERNARMTNTATNRFKLIPYGNTFILGYTPGFVDSLPTLGEREQNFGNK